MREVSLGLHWTVIPRSPISHRGPGHQPCEKGMRECPDSSMDKCSKSTQHSGEITQSQTNSVLFRHTLEYQNNMIQLITRSQEAIQGLHDHIWDVVHWVMESAGKSTADSLEIALCLVDMLPSIHLHLTFNTAIADLPRFTPEALTYTSLPSTYQGAMTAPSEETLSECTWRRRPGNASHMAHVWQ